MNAQGAFALNSTLDPANAEDHESNSGSESTTDDDETWDDWKEDPTPCKSLFEELILPSASQALEHDIKSHGFDLNKISSKMGLDFHRRVRFINYIRKNKVPAASLLELNGKEDFFFDDSYLQPVLEDDPLLQLESNDWSDDDETTAAPAPTLSKTPQVDSKSEIESLRAQLESANLQISKLLSLTKDLVETSEANSTNENDSSAGNEKPPRDDDTHYFESYGYQEIHATMLQDSVRTSSYAKFILSNPQLFRGKLVMDIGCGTGILSMFAARAGARHVFAVDASSIVHKARQNVKDNGLEDVISVIQGKIEDITLPAPYDDPSIKMDVIVSEWMGYALLYESMLDSVLVGRDRWLQPSLTDVDHGGVMAPSQCRMVMSLAETPEVVKDKITFWEDVYGFKMSSMGVDAYNDALIENVKPEAVISNLVTIKDLPIQRITVKQLDFTQSFKFVASRDGVVHSFLLYFDTWFVPDGSDVPEDAQPDLTEVEGNFVTADYVQVTRRKSTVHEQKDKDETSARTSRSPSNGGRKSVDKSVQVSFSTGPASLCTHWKQTIFLLRSPFKVIEGSVVTGTFYCHKSETNSRELDVEIHYAVSHTGLGVRSQNTTVQMFKVR